MPLSTYGLIKGSVIGHLRDADDDHYQLLLRGAAGAMHRVAVNVRSSAPNAPSTVLFRSTPTLPPAFTALLQAQTDGVHKLPRKAGGLAIDYLRSGFVRTGLMRPLAPDLPGANNDLKDQLETAVLKAIAQPGAKAYAFGAIWGPEKTKPDTYFRFTPGSGIHDIHMNQGNTGRFAADNGCWQDGALILEYPATKTWRAFFFAFQSQSFKTDGKGNPLGV